MTASAPVATGLGRPERLLPLPDLRGKRVVVTGSNGYIGSRITGLLADHGATPVGFDLPRSVLDPFVTVDDTAAACLHLAAHKYATTAEDMPAAVASLNVQGTENIAQAYGPGTVLVSTCKAADPMTVYGASKLIAERIVLNHGGKVVRLVNVVGSTGSVAELWDAIPTDQPLPVVDAHRMWMTAEEACRLIIAAAGWLTPGRYALDVPPAEPVSGLADRLHPGREQVQIPLRRGDRYRERLIAEAETVRPWAPGTLRITHPCD